MESRWMLVCLTMFAMLSQPFAVLAQTTNDWAAVRALGSGQKIRVEAKTGKKIIGKLSSVSDEKIVIDANGKAEEVSFADVKKVYRVGKGSRVPGIAIGAAAGAGVGAATGVLIVTAVSGTDDVGSVITPLIVIGSALGALAGAFVRKKKRMLIYEAR